MNELLLILFAIGFGFVAAAIFTFSLVIASESGKGFRISLESRWQIATGFVLCMFAGPFLTMKNSFSFWRQGLLSNQIFMVATLLSVLWSFFSGVLITEFLVFSGMVSG